MIKKRRSTAFAKLRKYTRCIEEKFAAYDSDEILEEISIIADGCAATHDLPDNLATIILLLDLVAKREKIDLQTAVEHCLNGGPLH